MSNILNDSTTWGVEANKINANFEAEAIQLLRLHNPDLVFQGFTTPTSQPATTTENHAWIVAESGTISGLTCTEGQIIKRTASAYVVEDIKEVRASIAYCELKSNEEIILSGSDFVPPISYTPLSINLLSGGKDINVEKRVVSTSEGINIHLKSIKDLDGILIVINSPTKDDIDWEYKMLQSYMELNPEQAKWFNTIEVETLSERDRLNPSMGEWCFVSNIGDGTSKEYVYDSNVSAWIDAQIDNRASLYGMSSGRACKEELLSRLSPGEYLHTTFGPSGLNKTVCDFVYLLLTIGDVSAKPVNFSGSSIRYDCDGSVVSVTSGNSGLPAYTLGVNKGIITFSKSDGFDKVTLFHAYMNNFSGSSPAFNFPGIISNNSYGSFNISNNKFCGELPYYKLDNALSIRFNSNRFIGTSRIKINETLCTQIVLDANLLSGKLSYQKMNAISSLPIHTNSFNSFIDFFKRKYDDRSLYDNEFSINLMGDNMAEPSGPGITPRQAYEDGRLDLSKYYIYMLQNDPLGEGFKKNYISFNQEITGPVVVFTFDDGNAEHATLTRNMFNTKGVKCTFYITTGFIGNSGYMTIADLLSLNADGFDLQCHSHTHPRFNELTELEVIAEFDAVNNFFITNGLPIPKHHAYPNGISTSSTILRNAGRITGRNIGNTNNRKTLIVNTYDIDSSKAIDGLSSGSLYTIKTTIDAIAEAGRGYYIMYGHGVYNFDPSESNYFSPANINAIGELIDYCISKGVAVMSMSQFYDQYVGRV